MRSSAPCARIRSCPMWWARWPSSWASRSRAAGRLGPIPNSTLTQPARAQARLLLWPPVGSMFAGRLAQCQGAKGTTGCGVWKTLRARPQARATEDVTLLAVGKADYEELAAAFPEQHEAVVAALLAGLGLDADGGGGAPGSGEPADAGSDPAKERARCGATHGRAPTSLLRSSRRGCASAGATGRWRCSAWVSRRRRQIDQGRAGTLTLRARAQHAAAGAGSAAEAGRGGAQRARLGRRDGRRGGGGGAARLGRAPPRAPALLAPALIAAARKDTLILLPPAAAWATCARPAPLRGHTPRATAHNGHAAPVRWHCERSARRWHSSCTQQHERTN